MNTFNITIRCETTMNMEKLLKHLKKEFEGKYYGIPKGVTIDPNRIIKMELVSND